MNSLLKWACLPLPIVLAIRYFSLQPNEHFFALNNVELYVFGACAALGIISFWHNLIRERCPQCKTYNPIFLGEKEVDRFIGSKEAKGEYGEGRTTRHQVSTTLAKLNLYYSCPNCSYKWHNVVKREVK